MECSIPVAGNGLTLGVTDGTYNFGLNGENSGGQGCFGGCTGLYGGKIGASKSGTISKYENGTGVTKDSSKSGLVGTLPSRNINSKELGRWFIRF